MPIRLSRQMFYILAAVCMCTWIYITHQVINSGVDENDVHSVHILDTSSVGSEELKWNKGKNKYILNGNIKGNQREEIDMTSDSRKAESTEYNHKPSNQSEIKMKDTNTKGIINDEDRKREFREELVKEDSEDYEVDRAAKYIHDDQERHVNVNDDGEDNNEESEDDVGDDNDYEEISVVKVDENNKNMFDAMHKKSTMIISKNKDRVNDKNLDFQNAHINNLPVAQKDNFINELIMKQENGNGINESKDHINVKQGAQPFAKYKNIEGEKTETNQSDMFHDDGRDPENEKEALEEKDSNNGFHKNESNHRYKVDNKNRETVENKNSFVNMSNAMNLKEGKQEKNEKQNQSKGVKQDYVSGERGQSKDPFRILQNRLVGVVADRVFGIAQGKHPVLGEMGTGVNLKYDQLTADEKRKMEELYKLHGFNAYVSNMISVNRTLPDMRSENCKQIRYDVSPDTTDLPQTSVIIVFHNEALSVLLRTIFSVINRSPNYLLKEIILVDDFSYLENLESRLDSAIGNVTKVRLIRTSKHEGLIRARLIGTAMSSAPVLTFLDAHVECFKGWLEPLLERLVEKPNTLISPQIQTISSKTFKISTQDKVYVGGFQLSDMVFDWIPVQFMDESIRASDTDTARSPVFAGGQFAIFRSYFYKIGTYDKEMNLWGGENLELSFRVWMCGGTVEVHPCSNVAHVFRQTNPLENTMKKEVDNAAVRNNLRTAVVWMDDYKKFYVEKGIDMVDIRDISDRQRLRLSLQCKSFQWYIDNVYPGLYVPGQALLLGEIRNPAYGVCIDSGINVLSTHIGVKKCSNVTSQFWHLSKLNAVQRVNGCIQLPDRPTDDPRITLERCDGGGPLQHWVYTKTRWLYSPHIHMCLSVSKDGQELQLLKCERDQKFFWEWHNTGLEDTQLS